MKLNLLSVSPFSCTVEIINFDSKKLSPYYTNKYYEVYINNELIFHHQRKNVFTVFDLLPNTEYDIKVAFKYEKISLKVKTDSTKTIYKITPEDENNIQNIINEASDGDSIVFEPGLYHINPIFLKSNQTIYIKKDACLQASTSRNDFPILPPLMDGLPLGTWEGNIASMYAGVITGLRVKNVKVIGLGTIDGNAHNSDWWLNHKIIKLAARPRNIFLNYCENILFEGLTIKNSPSWTIHPFYSKSISFLNLQVINPKISPNTDGCNPESSQDVNIIGCLFSVGDDCIAIKSGKKEMVKDYYQPSQKITIRNCLMKNGHGAIVMGSEMSCGIEDLKVSNCLFINTDRGLRIKTRRGRGNKAVIDQIEFNDIIMKEVLNPFVINMFYYCDSDGKSGYVQDKTAVVVNSDTPYLGSFVFRNIDCRDAKISAGFFYGLPEQKIESITFDNVTITMKENDLKMYPAMMSDINSVSRLGCYFNNVNTVKINKLNIENQVGNDIILHNVNKFIK